MHSQEKILQDFAELVPTVEINWATREYLNGLEPGRVIIEVGVGNGDLTNRLHRAGHVVHAVDISPYCLEKLDSGITRHLLDIDVDQIPLTEGSADVIIIFNVLEHLRTPTTFLEHARKLVRPGGLILAATPNINWFPFRLYFLLGRCPEDFHNTNHVQFWNLVHFRKLFEETGWKNVRQVASIGMPNPLYPFVKSRVTPLWQIVGKYLFISSSRPHCLLGYEQMIIAEA